MHERFGGVPSGARSSLFRNSSLSRRRFTIRFVAMGDGAVINFVGWKSGSHAAGHSKKTKLLVGAGLLTTLSIMFARA